MPLLVLAGLSAFMVNLVHNKKYSPGFYLNKFFFALEIYDLNNFLNQRSLITSKSPISIKIWVNMNV